MTDRETADLPCSEIKFSCVFRLMVQYILRCGLFLMGSSSIFSELPRIMQTIKKFPEQEIRIFVMTSGEMKRSMESRQKDKKVSCPCPSETGQGFYIAI